MVFLSNTFENLFETGNIGNVLNYVYVKLHEGI